ncbi:hypothetical protein OE88DRAFT_451274 [Heliocybe sulcata]|uniref:BTB domain-containing protein n=1 Tax=Heliocybe sulcata TaxID=5364 RepID=A0A5C3MU31_9AGAM|nr:hypothetical protein OE88DRAFT_451274 [Heliocybe sulcata]
MKHASYYFADGSIVLSAVHSETKQVVLYRVQTTLLSRHSEVFADMLTMPSPPEAPTYEGAPLVHLPDTAEEIEAMVHCFYDPGRLYHEDVDPASPFWRDAMHMATKYIISSIRARIVASLEKQWPRTLQEWIAHEARKRFLYEEWVRRDDEGRFYDDLVPEPASAIRFARDFDVPSILPAAFYDLLLIDPKNDWDTCRRRGPAQEPSSPLKDGDRTARWDLLSALDFRALMAGREKLWQRFLEFEHSTEMDRHSKYGQAKSCPCVYATTATRHEWVRTSGVLQYFVRVADTAADGSGPAYDIQACKPCYRRIGERARSMREKVWDELAAMFTVDGDAASRGFIDPGSSTLLPEVGLCLL